MKSNMLRIGLLCIVLVVSCLFMMDYSKDLSRNIFYLESKLLNPQALSDKLLRFHVIANSDEEIDQNVKLKVKDAILKSLTPALHNSKSKGETLEILKDNLDSIEKIAEETLKVNGMNHQVFVALNRSYFPIKSYNDFALPAGDYLALRVVIGSGEGKNWWCVLFPPLCLVDVETEEYVKVDDEHSQQQKLLGYDEIDFGDGTVKIETDEDTDLANETKPRVKWKALEILGLYKN